MGAEPLHALAFPVSPPARTEPPATLGRIVLYRPTEPERQGRGGAEFYPAVVTRAWGGNLVNLHVLADAGPAFAVTSVEHDDAGARPRTWRWPPRA